MRNRHSFVAGLGQCALDYLLRVKNYPEVDQKCETGEPLIQGGGPVATALVALSRLGVATSFLGKIGDDAAGAGIIRGLRQEGVNVDGLVTASGSTSQTAFIIVEDGTAKRTIFWNRGSAFPLLRHELRLHILDGASLLHLDGLHSEAALEAAQYARQRGIPVMLDGGTLREEMRPLLPFVDYLVVSEGFARSFGGGDNPRTWLDALAQTGIPMVCVTLGARGSMALQSEQVYRQKAFSVDAIDTTGCGDAFHGGLIYGIVNHWPLREALEFASAVAALKCLRPGGRAGLPALDETLCFLREHRGGCCGGQDA